MENLVDVLLLVSTGDIHKSDVFGKGTHTVLKVNQVEDEVREHGQLGVVLTLLNHYEVFVVNLSLSVVLEDLRESDLITVTEVIHVLEELLLLVIRFIVITVLSQGLLNHVLTEDAGIINSSSLEGCGVQHELSNRGFLHVLLIKREEISLES